jgi:transcription-repair coupling factor (superfamily II helicase)
MILKDEELKCYFINRPDSPYFESNIFQNILSFIQTRTNKARLKQTNRLFTLVVNDMKNMAQVAQFLKGMHESVVA